MPAVMAPFVPPTPSGAWRASTALQQCQRLPDHGGDLREEPRSFADGNINHILVGSRIQLPTTAEASVITDAEARAKFRSDNASWKGLSPKYLASKHTQPAAGDHQSGPDQGGRAGQTRGSKVAPAKAAPIPAPAPKVETPSRPPR